MSVLLDKTHHQHYRLCACYGWHLYNKRLSDSVTDFQQYLFEEGNKVESLAQSLHPGGWQIDNKDWQKDAEQTSRLIGDRKSPCSILYQATAKSKKNLLAKADIIIINDRFKKELDLYEIKMASSIGLGEKKEPKKAARYLSDVAFQKITFEQAGYKIRKIFIIHINSNYCFKAKRIDPKKLFQTVNVTQDVKAYLSEVKAEVKAAQLCYAQKQAPICQCRFKPKSDRCPSFEKFNLDIPTKNSILSLHRISVKKIQKLLNNNILHIEDINLQEIAKKEFTLKQLNQIQVTQSHKIKIQKDAIKQIFKTLQFPLYFLDYESIGYAIPVFYSSRPNMQIPFQFSLHILNQNNYLKHHEYLMEAANNQELTKLTSELRKHISPSGSIIVWHQTAEKQFQNNLGQLLPEDNDFLQNLNQRLFDLEKIFTQQLYLDANFEGRTSLKKVLPVLVPSLSYENLVDIQDGQQASIAWTQALLETKDKRQQIFDNLLKYCKQDTLAMVEIYKFLKKEIA